MLFLRVWLLPPFLPLPLPGGEGLASFCRVESCTCSCSHQRAVISPAFTVRVASLPLDIEWRILLFTIILIFVLGFYDIFLLVAFPAPLSLLLYGFSRTYEDINKFLLIWLPPLSEQTATISSLPCDSIPPSVSELRLAWPKS